MKANFSNHDNREFTGTLWLTPLEAGPKRLTGTFENTAGDTQGTTDVLIK